MRLVVPVVGALLFCVSGANADPCTPAPLATWGVSATPTAPAPAPALDSPVARARDLLARARILDEQAVNDDRTSSELAQKLPALRVSAKAAREKADKAKGDDKEAAVAQAEDLEADVVVSEAEVIARKHAAADNRQTASMLRARALHIVREGAPDDVAPSAQCDPPYRFTADGRKIYRVECFR